MYEFSRKNRLTSKQDFQSVFANATKVSRKYLLILYRPNQTPHSRLGIIINKHRVKLAVERNQIRRVIRDSFRHKQEVLKGLDIVVLIRSECNPLDKAALRENIDKLWELIISSKRD